MDDRQMLEQLVAAARTVNRQLSRNNAVKPRQFDDLTRTLDDAESWLTTVGPTPPSEEAEELRRSAVASEVYERVGEGQSRRSLYIGELRVTMEGPGELTQRAEPIVYYDATEDGLLARKLVDALGGPAAFEKRSETELRTHDGECRVVVRGPDAESFVDNPTVPEVYERWARPPLFERTPLPGTPGTFRGQGGRP